MAEVTTEDQAASLTVQDGHKRETEAGGIVLPASLYPVAVFVKILIGDTWTDITRYVYVRDNIAVTGGKTTASDSGEQPGQCTMTINNRDGRFSPNYTAGAYYPYLQRNTPIQVGLTAVSPTGNYYSGLRFVGSVAKWPTMSDLSGNDVYVQITANGPLRQINQGGGKGSALTRYYSLLKGVYAPVAYWPCEEDPDTNQVCAGVDGGTNMTVTGGSPTWKAVSDFNGSAPIGVLNGSTWTGKTASFAFGSGDDLFTSAGGHIWTCPPGVSTADVQCIGGGGGGDSAHGGGGGGGGGEWAENTAYPVTAGVGYSLTVGAGGSGGNAGGASLFDGTGIRAHGGSAASGTTPGAGGTGSGAAVHRNGGAGATQQTAGTQATITYSMPQSGVWTAPPGVTSVIVQAWGAGGGGSNGAAGAGGGGGEYASGTITVSPGKNYQYQVGTGGAKGVFSSQGKASAGGNGTDSFLTGSSASVRAHGGTGGSGTQAHPNGGNGGTGSTATVHHNGGAGGVSNVPTDFGGGGGGGSAGGTGAGGTGGNGGVSAGGSPGSAGAGPPGGASGGTGGTGGSSGASGGASGNAPGSGGGAGGYDPLAVVDHEGGGGVHGQLVLTYIPQITSGGGGGGSAGSSSAGATATTAAGAAAVTGGGPGGNGGAGIHGSQPQSPPGGGGGGSDGSDPGANGAPGQVEVLYTPQGVPNINVIRGILFVPKHGGNPGRVLLRAKTTSAALDHVDLVYRVSGGLELIGYNNSGTPVFDSGYAAFSCDGTTIMFSVELANSGSSIAWKLSAILPGARGQVANSPQSGTLSSATVGNITEVIVAPNGDITKTAMGHISVQYANVDLTLVSRALDGHTSEMGIKRFLRLANEQALDNAPQFQEKTDHWGFETELQGWLGQNAALSRTAAWSSEGQYSLVITSTGEGPPAAFSPQGTAGVACNPGDVINAAGDFMSPVLDRSQIYIGIQFWDAAGNKLSETDSGLQVLFSQANLPVDPTTVLTAVPDFDVTAIAPSGVATFSVIVGDKSNGTRGDLLYIDNITVHPKMGTQTRKEYAKFLKEIRDLDQAIIRETRFTYNPYTGMGISGPGLYMRTKWTMLLQNPVLTLDYAQGHLTGTGGPSGGLTPVIDDKLTANHIVVHRHKGSKVVVTLDDGTMSVQEPPAGVGRYKKELKVIAERDEQLLNLANLLLALGTNTTERYPTLQPNMPRLGALMSLVASVEIGDFVQVNNLPFWYPSQTVKQLVIGYTETIHPYNWQIVWNCTPETPWELSVQQVGWY